MQLKRRKNGTGTVVFLGKGRYHPYAARILIGKDLYGKPLYYDIDTFEEPIDALVCLENYHKNPTPLKIKQNKYDKIVFFPKVPYPLVPVDVISSTIHRKNKRNYTFKQVFEEMKEKNPRRFKIEGDGDWGIAEGLIYTNVEQADFDIEEIRKIPGIKSAFNLDFGFTDPTAFVCEMVDNNEKVIYVFDEWYKTGTTNQKIAEQIKEMGYGGQIIICDSAEPKSIEELWDCGLRAEPSRKGRDSVTHGIQQIQNYKIVVHARNCPNFWIEIQNYAWQLDKAGKPTNKPEHEFSHGMDSMRYGVADLLMGDIYSFDF